MHRVKRCALRKLLHIGEETRRVGRLGWVPPVTRRSGATRTISNRRYCMPGPFLAICNIPFCVFTGPLVPTCLYWQFASMRSGVATCNIVQRMWHDRPSVSRISRGTTLTQVIGCRSPGMSTQSASMLLLFVMIVETQPMRTGLLSFLYCGTDLDIHMY